MDDTTKRAYIRVRLEKARDDLASARDCSAHSHWRANARATSGENWVTWTARVVTPK